jgi:hypothetical protein
MTDATASDLENSVISDDDVARDGTYKAFTGEDAGCGTSPSRSSLPCLSSKRCVFASTLPCIVMNAPSFVLEEYMQPPPTPSKNIADAHHQHRNILLTTPSSPTIVNSTIQQSSYRSQLEKSVPQLHVSLADRISANQVNSASAKIGVNGTIHSGFDILKSIGFAEMLNVASFDKKPVNQVAVSGY